MFNFTLFLSAIILGAISTWLIRTVALKLKIVNNPNPIVTQHTKPIAYLGGIGVFGGIILTSSIFFFTEEFRFFTEFTSLSLSSLTIGAILFLVFGVADDIIQLNPLYKFIGQFILSVISVLLGIKSSLWGFPIIDFIFSVFVILFIINAVNFTDVCDGLVGGLSSITFLILGLFHTQFLLPGLLISGATIGFMFFNFPKASIFLGDAGAHFLGFLIAAFTLNGLSENNLIDSIVWLALFPGIFNFELFFITAIRIWKGLPWWKGSPDHFSLRLQAAGLSRAKTDLVAWALCIIIVLTACNFSTFDNYFKVASLISVISILAIFWRLLLRWEVKN